MVLGADAFQKSARPHHDRSYRRREQPRLRGSAYAGECASAQSSGPQATARPRPTSVRQPATRGLRTMIQPVPATRMDPDESLYLDLVRAAASFFVVLDHAPTLFDMPGTPRWGHQAVVVFFVLSGYVISHVSDTKEPTGRAFVVARLARLWSVLVPAMVLT